MNLVNNKFYVTRNRFQPPTFEAALSNLKLSQKPLKIFGIELQCFYKKMLLLTIANPNHKYQ